MSTYLYKKNKLSWRLDDAHETNFRLKALDDTRIVIAGICVAMSILLWPMLAILWDLGSGGWFGKMLPVALIQLLLLGIFWTTRIRTKLLLLNCYITPLYGVCFLLIYMGIYGPSISPDRQQLMNGVVVVLIICFCALDRILPPVSFLGGTLYAITFLWFADRSGVYNQGQFAQITVQCFLANIMGGAIGFMAARQARLEYLLQLELAAEKEISENLLQRVLPSAVATKIAGPGMRLAESHPDVTVLFADLVGFTALTERMRAEHVVEILDELFTAFDRVCAEHEVEKIKTIGDAYMAVSGCPVPKADHAHRVAAVALKMRSIMSDYSLRTGYDISIRIGINSGPVVAGVICDTRFCYDVWGSTVNQASRLESAAQRGTIMISESSKALIAPYFTLGTQQYIEAKGIGRLACYELLDSTEISVKTQAA